MKFLCLHGMGTNSDVYEAQLGGIIGRLDPTHTFVFVDGLVACEPAEGVDALFPGPFCCYYDKPVAGQLEAAYALVREVLDEEGPFDGVVGFSQGAALAASLLLRHQATHPHGPDLFRLAVFAGASLPFDRASADPQRPNPYHAAVCPRTGAVRLEDGKPAAAVDTSLVNGFLAPLVPGDEPLHRYHPLREKARIAIPTVHILGRSDPFYPQGRLLAELCAEPAVMVEHHMGHLIPREAEFARRAANAIEGCVHRALSKC